MCRPRNDKNYRTHNGKSRRFGKMVFQSFDNPNSVGNGGNNDKDEVRIRSKPASDKFKNTHIRNFLSSC